MDLRTLRTEKTVPEFLLGGGEMGQRMREFDWSGTSLGPSESWPRSLRTCVQIMLNSRQPIWIGWGPELIKLYNDAYKTIVAGKHPWALGKPASVVWSDIWKQIDPMLKQVMVDNEGTYVESQLLIMERSGYPEETYYTFSYTPIAGDDGKTEGMICANTDDTERITSQRQLSTLTQLGQALSEAKTDEEVFTETIQTFHKNKFDIPFALLYVLNDNQLRLTAHTPLHESADLIPERIDLSASGEIPQLAALAIKQKKIQVMESLQQKVGFMPKGAWEVSPDKAIILPIARRGQKEAYGLLVLGLNPYRLFDEKFQSFYGLVADQVATAVTNVHAMEEERKRAEALADLDRAKTAFFSNISHEFRTPLTLLLGPIEELLGDRKIESTNREKVKVAFRNALRMQKLVNLLLDFSRIEAGRMEAQFSPVDILALTSDLASNFRSAIEKAGMQLTLEFPDFHEPVYVDVDMWEKIILNLISNAFKYTEKGSITIKARRKDEAIEISVTDTGMGIPENELDKIFERFHRVQNVGGRSQEGTGIGLAMVKELVKLHGGSISAKSEVGKGSNFTVSLPLGAEHLHGKIITDTLSQPLKQGRQAYIEEINQWTRSNGDMDNAQGAEPKALKKKSEIQYKVLLADDNADMRVFVNRLLENDYHVVTAADGEEAFQQAIKELPDLILSDVMMPKLDGFGLLRRLRENMATRNIPFVFLSARAGEEAKVEGLNAGADDYLIKPFSSKELLARVASHISISGARRKVEKEFFNLFLQSPVHIHVMKGPEHVLEFFHPLGIRFTGRDITGMKLREAFPAMEGQGYFEMLDQVYKDGKTIHINESKATFTLENGQVRDHYFNISYLPWRDLEEKIQGVLQFTFEVTDTVELRLQSEANEKRFREIAKQAPVAMALLMGPDHIVEVANDKVLELWDRTYKDVIGKPVLDIFPEIVRQGFADLLGNVYKTGEPFIANEMPVTFVKGKDERTIFVNLLYEPFRNGIGEIEGIVAVGSDVTEQVNARQKLADAELRARTIIEQTPSPLCIFRGEDMVLEVANDAALQVWQVGPEVVGKKLVDIVPEMERQVFLEILLDVYKNGITRYGFEAPAFFVRKTGEIDNRFFNFHYVPFYNSAHEISGVLVLASDVTDQVASRKQLVDNEERLRISSEILELGTWEYDVRKDEVYLSERSRGLFGYRGSGNVKLAVIMESIVPRDRERVKAAVEAAFRQESEGRFDQEFSVVNEKTGNEKIIRSIAQTFFNDEGLPVRVVGTAIDITERKKAEEKLIASEARFRSLAMSIPQIVWTTSPDGTTTFLSEQVKSFTGVDPERALVVWGQLIHPDDAERVASRRRNAIEKGISWTEEFRLIDGKGGYRWFLGNSNPMKDVNGNVIMYIGAASDIQDLKEQSHWLEKQVQERTKSLKELNQSLKLSNEDLQQFAHVASHDLKEPIRKIKTFSNRLKDEFSANLPERAGEFLGKILSATDRMYTMIDGVLSYSTFNAIDQPMEFVDLNAILKNIQEDLEVIIHEKKAEMKVQHLPMVYGASVLLYQLFYNLVNNSLKFSRENVPPVISIASSKETIEHQTFNKIVVRDNGIGFDQEQGERIFATFTRLNSKDRYEGTGLGLALCKKIVQRHGGTITAAGERNQGSKFTILLPVKS